VSADPVDAGAFAELQTTAGAEFVAELAATFREEAPRMLDELRAAAASGRADAFRRAAHSLKSNANTFGAFALGALARDLELAGVPAGGDTSALDAIAAEYARVATRLGELAGG
jgi:HPt (histidine-containing phosphotransfer) domain-containing protein